MSRRRTAPSSAEGVRRPRPAPTPILDARLLVLAAVIASPAAYLATEGMLSPSTAVERFLVIALGCLVLSAVVRTVWPLVIGGDHPSTAPARPEPGAPAAPRPVVVEDAAGLPSAGSGLDLLEDDIDPASLLELP